MRFCFFPVLAIALLVLSCPHENNEPGETRVSIPVDLMGMVHAGYTDQDGQGNTGKLESEYALLETMGAHWMLRDFSWSSIEKSEGNWEWGKFDKYVQDAADHGKKIMALLAYDVDWLHDAACGHSARPVVAGAAEIAAYCEYARQTVSHFKGKVGAWCLWNEPNLSARFWGGTLDDFFALTKAAAAAIREVDPDAVIIGGSLNTLADNSTWTRGLFESGAMNQVDFVAYHPYTPDAVGTFNVYDKFRNAVSVYGFENKIWITEVGYPMRGNYGTEVAEDKMPLEVTKTITLLAAGGAKRILWYEMFDRGAGGDPDDSEDWFGLVNWDTFAKKGGADAYQLCSKNLSGKTMRSSLPLRSEIPDDIAAYYFEGADGKHTLVIWNNRLTQPQNLTVSLPGINQTEWNIIDGTPHTIGESSEWTLEYEYGTLPFTQLRFFTWENSDLSKVPRISAR